MNENTLTATVVSEVTKTSISTIYDKIHASKSRRENEQTISELIDLINDIINEREEIYLIAKKHEEELYSKLISDEEISFILDNLIPILEKYIQPDQAKTLDDIKTLLSVEVIRILQLIGFDIKRALGEPLTDLVAVQIRNQMQKADNKLELENEILFKKLLLNKDTREMAKKVYNIE